jgi:small-conductance mechanosensitive channel
VSNTPSFLHQHAKVLIEIPLRIVLIILVALVLRAVLHRMINRATRPASPGTVPRILRPLGGHAGATTALLESSGIISERRVQRAATLGSVLKSSASVAMFGLASLLVLGQLGIDLAPLIAGTSIAGVAVAFGAQNVVKDFLSGLFMMFEDQYGVGDVIDFEKATGTVEAVGLRTTTLRDENGTVWYVRNGEVVRVGNRSQGAAEVVLDVPLARSTPLAPATATMLAVARELRAEQEWARAFLGEPEVHGVESFTLAETVIRLSVRVRPPDQWRIARELRRRLCERLDSDLTDSAGR